MIRKIITRIINLFLPPFIVQGKGVYCKSSGLLLYYHLPYQDLYIFDEMTVPQINHTLTLLEAAQPHQP